MDPQQNVNPPEFTFRFIPRTDFEPSEIREEEKVTDSNPPEEVDTFFPYLIRQDQIVEEETLEAVKINAFRKMFENLRICLQFIKILK